MRETRVVFTLITAKILANEAPTSGCEESNSAGQTSGICSIHSTGVITSEEDLANVQLVIAIKPKTKF
jgi:hypothetical protein